MFEIQKLINLIGCRFIIYLFNFGGNNVGVSVLGEETSCNLFVYILGICSSIFLFYYEHGVGVCLGPLHFAPI